MGGWYRLPIVIPATALLLSQSWAADLLGKAEPQATPEHASVFSGFEYTSQGSYIGFLGGTFAPFGSLDESGLRLGLFGGYGGYRYDSATTIRGTFTTADMLVGYGVEQNNISAKLYLGLNLQDHNLSASDPANPVQGTKAGFKVQGDIWTNPTAQTLLFALASYSTAFNTYYATGKAGYDISGGKGVFIGPQVTFLGNDRFDQWRLGVHLTEFEVGVVHVGVSGGYLSDRTQGSGAYGAVDLSVNF